MRTLRRYFDLMYLELHYPVDAGYFYKNRAILVMIAFNVILYSKSPFSVSVHPIQNRTQVPVVLVTSVNLEDNRNLGPILDWMDRNTERTFTVQLSH